jgi:MFS family permease
MLADRVGRRATLLLGTAGAGTLMLALGSARGSLGIWVFTPLLGFFTEICRPPLQAAVADVVPPGERARAYGLLYWAVNLGFAGAASVGGLLAEHHFHLLFVIDALTTYGYGLIVLAGVPETRPALPPERTHDSGARALIRPLGNGPFVSFVAIQMLVVISFLQVIAALPLDMRAHGLGTQQIGWLLGMNGVFIVLVQPLALRLLRGLSSVRWLVAGAVFTGLGLGATAFAAGSPVYLAAILLWTLGEIGFSTGAPTLVAEFSPRAERGAYQGAYQLGWGLASMSAPAVGSLVLGHLGGRVLWFGSLGACLLAAALHLTVTARRVGG